MDNGEFFVPVKGKFAIVDVYDIMSLTSVDPAADCMRRQHINMTIMTSQ